MELTCPTSKLERGWRPVTRVVLSGGATSFADRGFGTPMKSLSLVFHHVLRPDEVFDMNVSIGEIRVRTFDAHVLARGLDGMLRFEGRLSPILVRAGTFESIEIPPDVRAALEIHQTWTAATG